MALDLNFIASVAERDIDLVVLEELAVNDEFQDWFVTRTYGPSSFQKFLGVWHSVSDTNLGETDILFLFAAESGERVALLVENKISAPPQPQQAERYQFRGQKGVKDGYWEGFRTCALAPQRYLESSHYIVRYDCEITYEEVLAFFSSRRSRDKRFGYKAKIVQEAIEQNRRGYQPEFNDQLTAFVEDYYEKFGKAFPELVMQEPKPRPSNSDWIVFTPRDYPQKMWICHQLFKGYVKLFFPSGASKVDEISERYQGRLDDGMIVGPAGKSATITISVPKVAPLEHTFEEEVHNVETAIKVIRELDSLVREIELSG